MKVTTRTITRAIIDLDEAERFDLTQAGQTIRVSTIRSANVSQSFLVTGERVSTRKQRVGAGLIGIEIAAPDLPTGEVTTIGVLRADLPVEILAVIDEAEGRTA